MVRSEAGETSTRIARDGASLHGVICGDREDRPLFFIHGRCGDHTTWRAQLSALSDQFLTVAFDSRGMGMSTAGSDPCTMQALVDDVVGALDVLGVEAATLVGLSMGGGIAQEVALRYPERVDALVLISTSSEFSSATRSRFLDEAAEIESAGAVDEALIERMAAHWYTADFLDRHPEELADVKAIMARTDPSIYAQRCRLNAERDLTDRLSEITVPVLFIGGAEDPGDARSHARRFHALIPQFRSVMIAGVSHCLHVEAPGQVNEIIRGFVGGLDGTGNRNP